ncbi:unnamed protein product, partial [Scytosiphon promiscuus]
GAAATSPAASAGRANGERKRAGSGSGSGSSSSSSSSSKNGGTKPSPGAEVNVNGQGTPATAIVSSSSSSSSSPSPSAPSTAAGAAETQQTRLRLATEVYHAKRKAVGAALARAALARVQGLSWEDVDVDWCPEEHLADAKHRTSRVLGPSSLGAGVGSKVREGGGRRRGGDSAVTAAAAESVITGTENGGLEAAKAAAVAGEDEVLCMSSLFPLPSPKPVQYVKKGIHAVDSAVAAPSTLPAVEASPSPLTPSPLRPNGTAPQGETALLSPSKLATDGEVPRLDAPDQAGGVTGETVQDG